MDSIKKQARIAGLLYFLGGLTAPFSLIYVPGALLVPDDATATANHVRASETLLRLGIASELIVATVFIFVALALYRLFKGVSEKHAVAMVILLALSVPISFLDVLNQLAALILVSGARFLSAFEQNQLDALTLLFLRLHGEGLVIAQIFWGLWLFPFGILVIRSGFIPRVLGALLIVAGSGYLVSSLGYLVLPQFAPSLGWVATILGFGEFPIIFWLLIWGARPQPSRAPATAVPPVIR